jgi:hypothetical protein
MIKVGLVFFFIGCSTADSEWWWFPLGMMLIGAGLAWLGEHRHG